MRLCLHEFKESITWVDNFDERQIKAHKGYNNKTRADCQNYREKDVVVDQIALLLILIEVQPNDPYFDSDKNSENCYKANLYQSIRVANHNLGSILWIVQEFVSLVPLEEQNDNHATKKQFWDVVRDSDVENEIIYRMGSVVI